MTEQQTTAIEEPIAEDAAPGAGPQTAARQPMSFIMTVVAMLLISAAVMLVGQIVYHQWFTKPTQRISTLDLNEIMQIKQLQLTTMATRPGATDRDREAAYDQIGQFGRDIEAAISELQRDCNCVLVVRAAVLKGHHEDLTGELKKRLGMESASVEQALSALTGNGRGNK